MDFLLYRSVSNLFKNLKQKSFKIMTSRTTSTRKSTGPKKPGSGFPKRPKSSFFIFRDEVHDDLMKKHPGKKLTEIVQIIGNEWIALSAANKKKYQNAAVKLKEKYDKDVAEWEKAHNSISKSSKKKSKSPSSTSRSKSKGRKSKSTSNSQSRSKSKGNGKKVRKSNEKTDTIPAKNKNAKPSQGGRRSKTPSKKTGSRSNSKGRKSEESKSEIKNKDMSVWADLLMDEKRVTQTIRATWEKHDTTIIDALSGEDNVQENLKKILPKEVHNELECADPGQLRMTASSLRRGEWKKLQEEINGELQRVIKQEFPTISDERTDRFPLRINSLIHHPPSLEKLLTMVAKLKDLGGKLQLLSEKVGPAIKKVYSEKYSHKEGVREPETDTYQQFFTDLANELGVDCYEYFNETDESLECVGDSEGWEFSLEGVAVVVKDNFSRLWFHSESDEPHIFQSFEIL